MPQGHQPRSRKRERGDGGAGDELELPQKRNNRPINLPKPSKPRKTTLDAVMSKLTDMSVNMAKLNLLLQDIPVIREVVDSVNAEVITLKVATAQLTGTTNTLLNRNGNLAHENAELERSMSALEARVNHLSLAGNANALYNQRVHTGRRNCLSRLTLGQISEASLLLLASVIAGATKANIPREEFTGARLLRKANPTTESDPGGLLVRHPDATRATYAVVCSSQSTVNRMLAAKWSFGALKYSELDITALTNPDLVAGQPEDPLISINELLPSNIHKLLRDAKTQLKAVGFKFIWSRNLTVFAEFSNDSPVQIVNSPADIPRIAQLFSHERPNPNHQ